MSELRFENAAATTYEQTMGILSKQLASQVLRVVRLAPGQRVLDIASGTGLVAEAAAALVGPSGHVTATDISPAMIEQARRNLGGLGNVSFGIEDAQSLTFPNRSFDAVTCGLGIMFPVYRLSSAAQGDRPKPGGEQNRYLTQAQMIPLSLHSVGSADQINGEQTPHLLDGLSWDRIGEPDLHHLSRLGRLALFHPLPPSCASPLARTPGPGNQTRH